jgi:hypothetical protein
MPTAAEIANEFDKIKKSNDAEVQRWLKSFVEKDPVSSWRWIAGGLIKTLYDVPVAFGSGLVDVLRLGEGTAEGGWGFLKDGLRLVSLAGPAGRLLAVVRTARGAQAAKAVSDPGGQICTWMAGVKAVRQSGQKLAVKLEDLATAAGQSLAFLTNPSSAVAQVARHVNQIAELLRRLGARVRDLRNFDSAPGTMEDVAGLVKGNSNGVVMFSVKWADKAFASAGNALGQVGHTLVAFRDGAKGIMFADRSGRIVKSLSELQDMYPGIGSAVPYSTSALIPGATVIQGGNALGLAGVIALEVQVLDIVTEEKK